MTLIHSIGQDSNELIHLLYHRPLYLGPWKPIFHLGELFVGSYLRLPLECPQFKGLRVLGKARKGSGEVVHGIHLGTVQVEFYGASPSLQIAQSQENPVAPPISQLQVVENHQMDLPIILQVTEDGWSQKWSKDIMRGLSDLLVTGLGHWKQRGLEPQMLIDYLLCASYYPWHDTVLLGDLPSSWGCFVKMEKHRMLAHPEINTTLMNRQSLPPSKSQIKFVNIP